MGSSFTLAYDSIMMFSLFRYLKIDYPMNLHLFFRATDSYRMSINIIRLTPQSKQVSFRSMYQIQLFGDKSFLYNQMPNSKFMAYFKTSSFL